MTSEEIITQELLKMCRKEICKDIAFSKSRKENTVNTVRLKYSGCYQDFIEILLSNGYTVTVKPIKDGMTQQLDITISKESE